MKTLYLLRHAQAAPSQGEADKDRPLSPQGLEQAAALGKVMLSKDYTPEAALCSSALRTRQTLEGVMTSLPAIAVTHKDAIYEAGRGEILTLIQSTPETVGSLLIVGHNPTIHGVAALMAKEDKPAPMERLSMGYAPGSLSVLECPIESWAEIQPMNNPLKDVLVAADYAGEPSPRQWM